MRTIADTQRAIDIMRQPGPTTVQIVDIETYDEPSEGEVVLDWPTKRICWWHDGEWRCVGGMDVENFYNSTSGGTVSSVPAYYHGHYYGNSRTTESFVNHFVGGVLKFSHRIPPKSSANLKGEDRILMDGVWTVTYSTGKDNSGTAITDGTVQCQVLWREK